MKDPSPVETPISVDEATRSLLTAIEDYGESFDVHFGSPHEYPQLGHAITALIAAVRAQSQEKEYRVRWDLTGNPESATLPTREHAEQMIAQYDGTVTGSILWRYKATEWQLLRTPNEP